MPLRLRLALVFAAASAVVLAAVGAVLYFSVRDVLDEQIAEPAARLDALGDRDEVLTTLLALMLVVGPIALLLAAVAGYRLAGAALRPVESMRREAAEISSATSSRRLPVPEARDEVRRLGETLNEMLERLDEGLLRGGASSPTRVTSCGRRFHCSGRSSSWRCDGRGRRRSWSARSARRRKRWSG